MTRALGYQLGLGRISRRRRAELAAEGIRLADEGVCGSITYRDFRANGTYFWRRRQWFVGAIVVTDRRAVGLAWLDRPILNLRFDDPRSSEVKVAVERGDRLCVTADARGVKPGQSGTIELRFTTLRAAALCAAIRDRLGAAG